MIPALAEPMLLSWPGSTRPSSVTMKAPIVSLDGRLKGGHDGREAGKPSGGLA